MTAVSPEMREQAEDAIRVLDAVIARDAAYGSYDALRWRQPFAGDVVRKSFRLWLDAADHALHQMEIYKGRYGATR